MTLPTSVVSPPEVLQRWHRRARASTFLRRFTLMNRLLLVAAFLPTGMVKLLGQRFTTLPIDNSIGFFFEAMYRTGPYWNFIGLVQVLAAVLLLFPTTAALGAVLFFPVALSVLLITIGVGFGNTVYITALMLVSSIYLLAWDADRIWHSAAFLLCRRTGTGLLAGASRLEQFGWWLGAGALVVFFLGTRGLPLGRIGLLVIAIGFLGGLLVVVGMLFGHRTDSAKPISPPPA